MDLSIYQCGYEKNSPLQIKNMSENEHYIFYYIIAEGGTLQIQNNTEEEKDFYLSANTGFLVKAGEEKYYQFLSKNIQDYAWIEFGGFHVKEYINLSGLSSEQPIYIPNTSEQGFELLNSILRLVKNEEEDFLKVTGYMYLFMDCLIRTSKFRPKNNEVQNMEHYIQGAVYYIEQNYSNPISVEDLAKQYKLDRSYFSRLFKSLTGQSPQQFLIHFRMEKAAEKLALGNAPIGDVGISVGYPNILHFSSTFKKTYGISPKQYRRKYRLLLK